MNPGSLSVAKGQRRTLSLWLLPVYGSRWSLTGRERGLETGSSKPSSRRSLTERDSRLCALSVSAVNSERGLETGSSKPSSRRALTGRDSRLCALSVSAVNSLKVEPVGVFQQARGGRVRVYFARGNPLDHPVQISPRQAAHQAVNQHVA